MNFEYFRVVTVNEDIDIERIGNCYLEAYNDNGACFILWIKTDADGYTRVLESNWIHEFRPITLDGRQVSVDVKFSVMSFAETKVKKIISTFLNNPSYEITQVFDKNEEYTEEEKYNKLYNIIEFIK